MAARGTGRWESAFRRFRLTLLGDLDATDVLDQSRRRIRDARDALERTAPRSRRQPLVLFAPSPTSQAVGDGQSYVALVLEGQGLVNAHKILARDDDQAVDRAWVHADAHAFDVWDGWRFIARFEPRAP